MRSIFNIKMHITALQSGKAFADAYIQPGMTVVDLGGRNVNGSLKSFFDNCNFICIDMEADPSVDIVVQPGEPLPFEDGSIDAVVSSSCFEHDPCFWMTFREMCRIVKKGGHIYVSAPSNGPYHGYPGDNWRFYQDAAQSLSVWSGKTLDGKMYPVTVEETFIIKPIVRSDFWEDYIAVWKRGDTVETKIVDNVSKTRIGPLRQKLIDQKIIL